MRAPLVPIACAFALGILAGWPAAAASPAISGLLAAVCAAGAWRLCRRHRRKTSAVLGLWLMVGVLRALLWQGHPDHLLRYRVPEEPSPVTLFGVIVDDPTEPGDPAQRGGRAPSATALGIPWRNRGAISPGLSPGNASHFSGPWPPGGHSRSPARPGEPEGRAGGAEGGRATEPKTQVCVVRLSALQTNGAAWAPIRGRVRVTLAAPARRVAYGDEVLLEGLWRQPPPPGNPGEYDWRAALARHRIHAVVTVRSVDAVMRLRSGRGNWWRTAASSVRHRWESLIRRMFAARETGLLRSLLLGQRVMLDHRLKEAFVRTGTMHLLVISGFHVGLIALLLEGLLRLLRLPRGARVVLEAVGLAGYGVLTGMQPPVVRATLMAWVLLGALMSNRAVNWPNTVAAAALLMLWINPTELFNPSFQLSFGAVVSLLTFASRWRPREMRSISGTKSWGNRSAISPGSADHRGRRGVPAAGGGRRVVPRWLRAYVMMSLSATAAIWVGLWPLLAWYFYLLAPVSILANLLLVPLVSLSVMVGVLVLSVGSLVPSLMAIAAGVLHALLALIVACVTWCAQLPFGSWWIGRPPWWLMAGYYGLIAASLLRRRWGWSVGRLLACWGFGIVVCLAVPGLQRAASHRWLTLDLLDVGHGDCLVVRTPRGHTLLIDAGTQEAGRRRVVPFLRRAGIRRLDAVFITHTDEDHIGGVIPVLEAVRVERLLTNGVWDDRMTVRRVDALSQQARIPRTVLRAGMRLEVGPQLAIQVLHPPAALVPGVAPASNDNSLVLKMTYGDISMLLTGDIEEAGLPWLLAANPDLSSAVLKVPHHGSALGEATADFLAAVQPSWALISVGRAHALPSLAALEALRRVNADILTTHRHGAIRVETDGRKLVVQSAR